MTLATTLPRSDSLQLELQQQLRRTARRDRAAFAALYRQTWRNFLASLCD